MKGDGTINITGKQAMREAQTILVCAIIFAIILLLAVCAYADDLNPTLLKDKKLSVLKRGELAELQRVVAMKNDQIKSERKGPMMSILPLDLYELVKIDRPRILSGSGTIDLEFELDGEGNISSITFKDPDVPEVSVKINVNGDVTVQYLKVSDNEQIANEKQTDEFVEKIQRLLEEGSRDKELVENYDKTGDGIFDQADLAAMQWALAEKEPEDAEERGDDMESDSYLAGADLDTDGYQYATSNSDIDGYVVNAGGGKTVTFRAAESSKEPGEVRVLGEEQIKEGAAMNFAGIREAFEEFMEKMDALDKKKKRLKRRVEMLESFESTAAELVEGRRESSVAIDIRMQMFREEEYEARETLGAKLVAATGMSNVRTDGDTVYIGLGLPVRAYAEAEE